MKAKNVLFEERWCKNCRQRLKIQDGSYVHESTGDSYCDLPPIYYRARANGKFLNK